MYAVVTTGGKQYRVEAGSTLVVERLAGEPGSSVTLDRVLLVGDGDTVTVGTPTVEGASVRATVLGEELGPKIVVFKFKQKVKYRRRTGHRQHLTRLHIDSISADGKTVSAEVPKKAPAAKRAARTKVAAEAAPASTAAEAEPKPKTRRSAKPKAEKADTSKAAVATPAEDAAEKKPRARARAASATKAAATGTDAAEQKPKTRRSAKPKAEKAKEE